MQLTAQEAKYVLATLIAHKKLRLAQVRAALRWRLDEIRKLRERLASLVSLEDRTGSARVRKGSRRPAGKARKLSPRVRKLRRQQGRYMAFVRRLNIAQKTRVRAVREKQGLVAAIRLAASLATKTRA